jgi:hypothetical protein
VASTAQQQRREAFSRFTLAAAELFPSAEGGQSLFLFSDLDIRESFEATHAGSGGMNFLNPMGWEVFSAELGEVQAVVVDRFAARTGHWACGVSE